MPRRWNIDHQPHLIDPVSGERAVMPGESHEFTDEQIEAGLTGSWSEEDPRSGLGEEREWKRLRDAKRPDLNAEAAELGVEDPHKLPNRQAVIDAIEAAKEAQEEATDEAADESQPSPEDSTSENDPDDNPDPAEPGETEE